MINFDFDNPKESPLRPVDDQFKIEKGILKYRYGLDKSKYRTLNFLKTFTPIQIERKDIAEIEIKIKVKHTQRLDMGFSSDPTADISEASQYDILSFWTIPDNEFHVYVMDAKPIAKSFLDVDAPIRQFYFWPAQFSAKYKEDEIEVEYVRIISKKQKYSHGPCGLTYESKNDEIRNCVFAKSNESLKVPIALPDTPTQLKFGMGIFENIPAQFEVNVIQANQTVSLYHTTIDSEVSWHDYQIDLTPYAGQKVIIEFKTISKESTICFWAHPVIYSPRKEKLNVILIAEDATRADHLSCYGYNEDNTPNKDKFAKEGAVFEQAYSQETYTRSSCVSMLTSLYPSATGVWTESDLLNERFLTLPEIMRQQGFETALFTQNTNVSSNSELDQGFNTVFDYKLLGDRGSRIYRGEELRKWLESMRDRNFFLYLHILDPHAPYDPPLNCSVPDAREKRSDGLALKWDPIFDPTWAPRPTMQDRIMRYDQEIKCNDDAFPAFTDMLKKLNIYKNTLIIFVADHGEHLYEHGIWNHGPPGYRQVLHVPMIMVWPQRIPKNMRIKEPVQLLDIMPTILDFIQTDQTNLLIQGHSLRPALENSASDYLKNRICFSEEVVKSQRTDDMVNGSLFYGDFHVLTSDRITDQLSHFMRQEFPEISDTLFSTNVFRVSEDANEHRYLLNYYFDFCFNFYISRFLKDTREYNTAIWKSVVGDSTSVVKYDQKQIEQLKALGYVQ